MPLNWRMLVAVFLSVLLTACGPEGRSQQQGREELNPPPQAYTQSAPCTAGDPSCLTLVDYYLKKPGFAEALQSTLATSGLSVPSWMDKALSTRLVRTSHEGASFVTGRACEPRNCSQALYVVYNELANRVIGFYRSNERFQWIGNPDEKERDELCPEDQLCTLEPKISEIPPLLSRLKFPALSQTADFVDCSEYRGGLTAKDGFVCKDQYLASCPFGSQGCTISAQFVNQQLAMLSMKYNSRAVKWEALTRFLSKTLEVTPDEVHQTDDSGKQQIWLSTWRNGRVTVLLRRVKGLNALGERYDDIWVIFTDKAFSLFNP